MTSSFPRTRSAPLSFLAAGSGITPVISMIETALRHYPNRAIDLVYASRRESEIIFGDRLRRLSAGHPSFTVHHVLSQPDADWSGETGRLTGERAARLLHPVADTEIYLCGPGDLMAATTTALQVDGVPGELIHQERFYAAPQHTRTLPTEPHSIEFRRSRSPSRSGRRKQSSTPGSATASSSTSVALSAAALHANCKSSPGR